MARPTAPPGPPPPHFRPLGTAAPRTSGPFSGRPIDQPSTTPTHGLGPGAATVIAIVALLIGLVIGFFAGRAADSEPTIGAAAPPLTSPSTAPTSRPPGDTIPPTPPTDLDTPPSTDLDPTTLGTVDDPIPVGQAYILGLYEIEVRSVERDAGAFLESFNGSNPEPPQGSQHVLVELSVRFTDATGVGNPASIPLFLSDGTGNWNDFEASCGAVPGSILSAGLIEQGDEAVGNACFTVPVDVVDDLLLGTEGFSGPVYFALPE